MKQILAHSKKNGDKYFLVDDEDYEYLSQFNWSVKPGRHTFYVHRSIRKDGKNTTITVHKILVKTGLFVDHIDGNGLNNQKINLRICDNSRNQRNRKANDNKKHSKYKGVSLVNKFEKKHLARICVNKVILRLGVYETELEAARAYDNAAMMYFGKYCRLNFQ